MYDKLKAYCKSKLPFTNQELDLIDKYYQSKTLKKKELFFREGKICNYIGFIESGIIRHFHTKEALEKTCDISFENAWVTDFTSFSNNLPGIMNLEAMDLTTLFIISRENLIKLYQECNKYETFGRLMAEEVAQRATEIAISLSSDKPEERFQSLLKKHPDMFQRVPQKYIAALLGISPESLSRIRRRLLRKSKS